MRLLLIWAAGVVVLISHPLAAKATIITITYTGTITDGTEQLFNSLPVSIDGQPITVTYTFDTSLAVPGFYSNNGSSSEIQGSTSIGAILFTTAGPVVGSSSFSNPGVCLFDQCAHSESDIAVAGSEYSQSVSWSIISDPKGGGASVQTQLFANPAIPGDITAYFNLSGTDIGTGSVASSVCAPFSCENADFQVNSVTANADLAPTPLPATLPLFASGMIWLLWRPRSRDQLMPARRAPWQCPPARIAAYKI